MAWGSINQLINLRKRVVVLRTCFVEINIINTYSPIFIWFFDQYNISKPLGLLYFNNKPCLKQLIHLVANRLLAFKIKLTKFCFIGQTSGEMFKWCWATSGYIRGISLSNHASVFFLRKLMSYTCFSLRSVTPILTTRLGQALSRGSSTCGSIGSRCRRDVAKFWGSNGGVSSWAFFNKETTII